MTKFCDNRVYNMKRTLGFMIVILLIAVIRTSSNHGMTTEKEISAFVTDNLSVIKSCDTAQIFALSEELTLFDSSSVEYSAFVCGTSGFGPDGTYYGFYISFDNMPHEMTGCNEYRTTNINENIYYFEYIVY